MHDDAGDFEVLSGDFEILSGLIFRVFTRVGNLSGPVIYF